MGQEGLDRAQQRRRPMGCRFRAPEPASDRYALGRPLLRVRLELEQPTILRTPEVRQFREQPTMLERGVHE